MAELIDGKAIAREIKREVAERAALLPMTPFLAAVLVGDDPASATYVRMKQRDAEISGMGSSLDHLSADTSAEKLEHLLLNLNETDSVSGILLQLPLPKHLDSNYFISLLDPHKDVDGLHPINQGLLMQGRPRFVPCTPAGVIEMIKRSEVLTKGANVVVVGRSVLVGRPLSVLLSSREINATVTVCHTATKDLAAHTKQADIIVVAAGSVGVIGAEHVRPGQIVIDVGTNWVDGKLVGDVDFNSVEPIVKAISPVPGGVGPLTRALLMSNTVLAAENSIGVLAL